MTNYLILVITIFRFCHVCVVNSRGDLSRGLYSWCHDINLISGIVQRYECFFYKSNTMGVSLAIYRARIGLFNCRLSNMGNKYGKCICLGNMVLESVRCACVLLDCDAGYLILLLLIEILLVRGGDVELNPGPAGAMVKRLSICHANIRSIQRCNDKLDHIKEEFCGRFDVITLSETWLKPTDGVDLMGRSVYHLDGYQDPIRRDRVGSRGGGVLAWVSNSLVCKRRNDLEIENAELMWLEIRCSNQKCLLAVAYRTDDQGNFWDILQESYIRALPLGIHYIIITGDLNADPSTHHGNKLMEFIEANKLTKLINVPTRITETSASELDQILTNCSSIIQEVDLLPPVSYNDHHTVSVRLNFKIAKRHSYNR